ncbi:MAG: hypothetical protein ABIS50_03860 [Luteolibacter sp.]|uniref:hypothetical protein n=1 Tax=Luteolibacter sp. TaxID=1962973 RepID=UPI003262E2A1
MMKTAFSRFSALALVGGLWATTDSPAASLPADPPPYVAYFNPETGFRPAQRNFQAIFLQMAGSFEYSGTPEPYLRHVIQENNRVETAYHKATGKKCVTRPAFFTDDYVEGLITAWNQMSRPLALESLCRKSGVLMRYAMLGSWSMSTAEVVACEPQLSQAESTSFQKLIEKPYFSKSDLPAVDAFYSSPAYKKMSDSGKAQLSKRTWRGTMDLDKRATSIADDKRGTILLGILSEHQKSSFAAVKNSAAPAANSDTLLKTLSQQLRLNDEQTDFTKLPDGERDALVYSHLIKKALDYRMAEIRKQVSADQMKEIEKNMRLILENLLAAAHSEYETGLVSESLDRKH